MGADHGQDATSARPAAGQLVLTREQVRRVDRIAIERFGVPGIVLMENAARGVVDAIHAARISHGHVLILCGGGNNGGDGLAVARHLHNRGSNVTIGLCTDPAKYAGDAAINWRIVQAMKLPTVQVTPSWLDEDLRLSGFSTAPLLVIDAIFGTGLTAAPRDPFPAIVDALDRWGGPVVSIDLPSGLDCDTGRPLGPRAVRAELTVTFVGRKLGFVSPTSAAFTGRVEIVDIGCPRDAIDEAVGVGPTYA